MSSSSSWMVLDDSVLRTHLFWRFCLVRQQPQHGHIFQYAFSVWIPKWQPVTLTVNCFLQKTGKAILKCCDGHHVFGMKKNKQKPQKWPIFTTRCLTVFLCACCVPLAAANTHMLQYADWHSATSSTQGNTMCHFCLLHVHRLCLGLCVRVGESMYECVSHFGSATWWQ